MSAELSDQFHAVLAEGDDGGIDPATSAGDLPDRLMRAACQCLRVPAAAVSIHNGTHRLAIGTSGESAARAERLQFTLGTGPALDASTGRVVAADHAAIWHRWSAFAAELFAQTSFRSIITSPLSLNGEVTATLDLYLTDEALADLRLLDVALVSDLVTGELDEAAAGGAWRAWLDRPAVERRHDVWIAVGRVMQAQTLTEPEALALLRAHTLTRGSDLDAVAHDVMTGALDLADLGR